jgi:preprotein translocase subunit SecG
MPHALHPRRSAFWMLAALLFGLLVLPLLVHLTGSTLLGAYSGGGAGAFFGDYRRGLFALRWYSWALALGPLLIVVFWRILLPTRSGRGVERGSG